MTIGWKHVVVGLSICCAASCQSDEAARIRLDYSLTVPGEVLEAPAAGAQDVYAACHREGWDECLERFLGPPPDESSLSSEMFVETRLDPSDVSAEPAAKEESDLARRARRAGFQDCREALKALAARYGEDNVRWTLARSGERGTRSADR